MPDGFDLLGAIAVIEVLQRATEFFVEKYRHLADRINRERIAHPALIITLEQACTGVGQINPSIFKHLSCSYRSHRMTGHANETAIGSDKLLANQRGGLVDRRSGGVCGG